MNSLTSDSPTVKCPHCRVQSEYGISVCSGCHAEVLYRATFKELVLSIIAGVIIGPVLTLMLLGSVGIINGVDENSKKVENVGRVAMATALGVFTYKRNKRMRFVRRYRHR